MVLSLTKGFIIAILMGGHISQKWYEFTTGEPEIDCYDSVYRLVIENVDRCD